MTTVATLTRAAREALRRLRRSIGLSEDPGTRQAAEVISPEHEQIIRRVLSTIHNNSILIRGEPGSGTTAVLRQIKTRLAAGDASTPGFFPVEIDLHGVPEILLFSTIAHAVATAIDCGPILHPADRDPDPSNAYGHRDLANDIRRALRRLKERGFEKPRLVLLVDGIDVLNTYSPRSAQRVRSLFMASFDGSLVMVATAVEIDRRWEEEGSPWFNFFEELELPQQARAPVSGPGSG